MATPTPGSPGRPLPVSGKRRIASFPSSARGATMVELAIVVLMIGIAGAMAMPGFSSMVINAQLTSYTNKLIGALSLGRGEAVKRGTRVTLCQKSADSNTCGTDWNEGWLLFVGSIDTAPNPDSSDDILRVGDPIPGDNTITAGGDFSASITFLPNGKPTKTGTLTLCNSHQTGKNARVITIGLTGHVRKADDAC